MKRGTGIVVEMAENNHVIVMTSQGKFVRVPFTKPVCVGQEIQYLIRQRPDFWKWSMAAALFIAIATSAGHVNLDNQITNFEPEYFVTVDINPSLELAVNSEQVVVGVEGLNNDGKKMLNKISVVGRTFKDALSIIESQAEYDGYLKSGENEIVVTISQNGINGYEKISLDEVSDQAVASEITDAVQETLGTIYRVTMWRVSDDTRKEARDAGLTPANYIAVYVNQQPKSSDAKAVATIERNGNTHYFEFEITRPVLQPVTMTR